MLPVYDRAESPKRLTDNLRETWHAPIALEAVLLGQIEAWLSLFPIVCPDGEISQNAQSSVDSGGEMATSAC